MRLLPRSLTTRLVLTAVALLAVVSLLVTASSALIMRSYLYGQLDHELAQSLDRADQAVRGAGGPGDPAGPDPADVVGDDSPPIPVGQRAGSITVVSDLDGLRGVIITTSGNRQELSTAVLSVVASSASDGEPRTIELPGLGSFRIASLTTLSGDVLWQALPTKDVDDTIVRLVRWESLLAFTGVAMAAVAGRQLVRRQLRPLRDVASAAHEVALMPLSDGQVGHTVRVTEELTGSSTEVGQVGDALNRLLGHVEGALDARHESEQQVRQFLADASHELRTPLATIRGYAELYRRIESSDPDEIVAKVETEAGRMSTLVEDMLLLARLDAGRPVEHQPVDLTRLIVEGVNDARVVDPDRQWAFSVPDEPVVVSGDEQRLHQALTNVLLNASRHTPPDTTITVTLRKADAVSVEVHDDGPGIAPNLLPTVFERFSRGDSSRTRQSGGAGLGMSLVRAIMHAHAGEATVTSRPGDTTFVLSFPTQRGDQPDLGAEAPEKS